MARDLNDMKSSIMLCCLQSGICAPHTLPRGSSLLNSILDFRVGAGHHPNRQGRMRDLYVEMGSQRGESKCPALQEEWQLLGGMKRDLCAFWGGWGG